MPSLSSRCIERQFISTSNINGYQSLCILRDTHTMPRSVVDATRFTATSPHMYSKPTTLRSPASNTFSPSSSPSSHNLPRTSNPSHPSKGPSPNAPATTETPAEKVARLRAAHAAQKNAQISRWDRIVVRGRVVADAAHRFTAMGLIGLTGMQPSIHDRTMFCWQPLTFHSNMRWRNYLFPW